MTVRASNRGAWYPPVDGTRGNHIKNNNEQDGIDTYNTYGNSRHIDRKHIYPIPTHLAIGQARPGDI